MGLGNRLSALRAPWFVLIATTFGVVISNPCFAYDINLAASTSIKNQGPYPYCGLYAFTAFLELWSSREGVDNKFEELDPAFLAMAYNAEVGDGNNGTTSSYLLSLVQKYGVVPVGAAFRRNSKFEWPLSDWRESHKKLMDVHELNERLNGSYWLDGEWRSAAEYFKRHIGKGFTSLLKVNSRYSEPLKQEPSDGTVSLLRSSPEVVEKRMNAMANGSGFSEAVYHRSPGAIFTMSVVQLFDGYPVLYSANSSMVSGDAFGQSTVIDSSDLVAPGNATNSSHALVGVAYCDTNVSNTEFCSPFSAQMQKRNLDECIVFQNSWGTSRNDKGYVCVSRDAFARMIRSAYLKLDVMAKNSGTKRP
jgi:hypothetical protein